MHHIHGVVVSFIKRCREKQRKGTSELQVVNRNLTAMNKLLMEEYRPVSVYVDGENGRLQKQVSHLVSENSYMRQQLLMVSRSFFPLLNPARITRCWTRS
ncbi:putative class III homeodomain-leucine zipper family [Dioscorea sansibarensis]